MKAIIIIALLLFLSVGSAEENILELKPKIGRSLDFDGQTLQDFNLRNAVFDSLKSN